MGSADNTKQLLKEFVARESAATSINSAARMGPLPDWRDAWFTQSAAGGYTIVCPKITLGELRAGARAGLPRLLLGAHVGASVPTPSFVR